MYRHGRVFRSDLLVLRALKTELPVSRFGFTVRAALGNAVVRNRLKRRLRAAVRSLSIAKGWDVVVNARPGAQVARYQELRATLGKLMEKAGLLEGPFEK